MRSCRWRREEVCGDKARASKCNRCESLALSRKGDVERTLSTVRVALLRAPRHHSIRWRHELLSIKYAAAIVASGELFARQPSWRRWVRKGGRKSERRDERGRRKVAFASSTDQTNQWLLPRWVDVGPQRQIARSQTHHRPTRQVSSQLEQRDSSGARQHSSQPRLALLGSSRVASSVRNEHDVRRGDATRTSSRKLLPQSPRPRRAELGTVAQRRLVARWWESDVYASFRGESTDGHRCFVWLKQENAQLLQGWTLPGRRFSRTGHPGGTLSYRVIHSC